MKRFVYDTQNPILSLGLVGLLLAAFAGPAMASEPPPEDPPKPAEPSPADKPVELPVLKTTEVGAAASSDSGSKVAGPERANRPDGRARRERQLRRRNAKPVKERRAYFGGLGFASVAPFFGTMDAFQAALSQPEALGPSYGASQAGLMLGGGGGGVFFGHLWLGGKGYALLTPKPITPNGESTVGGGGGGFELGYVVQPGPGSLLIPYFGLQGFGYGVEVTNKRSSPMPIQTGIEIPAGETRKFSAGFPMLEAGIRFQRLVFFGGTGGMTAGFELGVLGSYGASAWKDEASGTELHELPSAGLSGMFVRLNFGGGGFTFR